MDGIPWDCPCPLVLYIKSERRFIVIKKRLSILICLALCCTLTFSNFTIASASPISLTKTTAKLSKNMLVSKLKPNLTVQGIVMDIIIDLLWNLYGDALLECSEAYLEGLFWKTYFWIYPDNKTGAYLKALDSDKGDETSYKISGQALNACLNRVAEMDATSVQMSLEDYHAYLAEQDYNTANTSIEVFGHLLECKLVNIGNEDAPFYQEQLFIDKDRVTFLDVSDSRWILEDKNGSHAYFTSMGQEGAFNAVENSSSSFSFKDNMLYLKYTNRDGEKVEQDILKFSYVDNITLTNPNLKLDTTKVTIYDSNTYYVYKVDHQDTDNAFSIEAPVKTVDPTTNTVDVSIPNKPIDAPIDSTDPPKEDNTEDPPKEDEPPTNDDNNDCNNNGCCNSTDKETGWGLWDFLKSIVGAIKDIALSILDLPVKIFNIIKEGLVSLIIPSTDNIDLEIKKFNTQMEVVLPDGAFTKLKELQEIEEEPLKDIHIKLGGDK